MRTTCQKDLGGWPPLERKQQLARLNPYDFDTGLRLLDHVHAFCGRRSESKSLQRGYTGSLAVRRADWNDMQATRWCGRARFLFKIERVIHAPSAPCPLRGEGGAYTGQLA